MNPCFRSLLGAIPLGNGQCLFRVWAPSACKVAVRIVAPQERLVPLEARAQGYFEGILENVPPGTRYLFCLDDKTGRPDPASRYQPEGVHGPSEVVASHFEWTDQGWHGLSLQHYIFYELHVGLFTPEGTFDAIIPRLPYLRELGITAVELMPIAEFPGKRNWGYDGVNLFAAHSSYGGPEGLKRLVNACHREGLAVVLDVVYNHLGPEGNYLADFGPYFTQRYKTPWGGALNFDGPHSDQVRQFFIQNALYWVTDCHIDALRLDAIHAILDHSATPFLQQLGAAVHLRAEQLSRRIYLVAESGLNDSRVIRSIELGGMGLDSQWNDDFHHALRSLLTGDRRGYYQDFGQFSHLVKAYQEGYVYSGQYSTYRRRRFGNSARIQPPPQFVVFAQNHDQVGNRMLGERLSQHVTFDGLKLAAAAVVLSPYLPLLFMGEEYGETAPFQYFVSHTDPNLIEAVRQGRKSEFQSFAWEGEPPDPQDEATFQRCKLNPSLAAEGHHRTLFEFYKELIRLRKTIPALASSSRDGLNVCTTPHPKVLCIHRCLENERVCLILHLGDQVASVKLEIPAGPWIRILDSSDTKWQGMGTAVPAQIESSGEINVGLGPYAAVLLSSTGQEPSPCV
ncbi:MAG: malto-oligosyltrehalose trehalohydrolase [Acidobacteriota bacterium]